MKKTILIACFGMLGQSFIAQNFEIDLQLKPRLEYRHGFKSLIPDDSEPALFVSQRSRLNFRYGNNQLQAYLSLQNVRVWGDVNTLSANDKNGTAIHEAWAMVALDSVIFLKIGRQEIVYDDSRVFGNVDWAQTGRSHDAFIAMYRPRSGHRLDLGLALNAEGETLYKTDYGANDYKSFQYLWYQVTFDHLSLSLLALNTGLTYDTDDGQKIDYSQTLGSHLNYSRDKLNADASLYFQTGKLTSQKLSAYNMAANLHYHVSTVFNIGLGAEYLSGTDMNSANNGLKSFNPMFGTNHKFNGWMDYFYVGNHINSVGLLDLNLPLTYQKNRLRLQLIPHVFSSAAKVIGTLNDKQDSYLGTEIDFLMGYKVAEAIDFQIGYSQMFASETMEILKGGNSRNVNNWAWAMFVFKPKLFTHYK